MSRTQDLKGRVPARYFRWVNLPGEYLGMECS